MTNNEVVEVLALARVGKGTEGRLYESLEHAIKCVELLPELVEMLKITVCEGGCCDCDNCDVGELLNKAKELME